MNQELNKILEEHKKWLNNEGGEYADLRGAKLEDVYLKDANLRDADFKDADLRDADLRGADLRKADLRGADLRGADLRNADLRRADFRKADLRNANLDFSAYPLWCGTFNMKIDDRLAYQLIAHLVRTDYRHCSEEIKEFIDDIPLEIKNKFCKDRDDVQRIS